MCPHLCLHHMSLNNGLLGIEYQKERKMKVSFFTFPEIIEVDMFLLGVSLGFLAHMRIDNGSFSDVCSKLMQAHVQQRMSH